MRRTGVDHVDGHRSPGYIISPYVEQQVNPDGTGAGVTEDSIFYTQVNMTRTIEQILGLTPMNQFDLVASPMSEVFLENPPAQNFLPWSYVPSATVLTTGITQTPTQTIPTCPTAHAKALASPVAVAQTNAPESPVVKRLRDGWMKKKAEIFAGKWHTPDA